MAAGAAGTGKGFINKYSDIVLAVVVMAIIGMLIVPLPTFLLDILLTVNISLSVIILLMSLYIPGALQFSVFPTLLLITTMYRLALTVSTTRLILSVGDAGEVVYAFGNFVARGNFVKSVVAPADASVSFTPGRYGRGAPGAGSSCDNRFVWDGTGADGRVVAPGVYLVRFRVGNEPPIFRKALFRPR